MPNPLCALDGTKTFFNGSALAGFRLRNINSKLSPATSWANSSKARGRQAHEEKLHRPVLDGDEISPNNFAPNGDLVCGANNIKPTEQVIQAHDKTTLPLH